MFPSMPEVVTEGERGVARVEHFTVSQSESMRSAFGGGLGYVPEGRYARLCVNGETVMSDTRMERGSNYEVARNANGNVLIAGLGLGMVLTAILRKPEVESVTVIEKLQDVIDLIAPHFPSPKLNIVCADIFEWKPEKGVKYDCVYFDIWPDISTDNLTQIATLHQRFKSKLNRANEKRWMGSWMRDHLRYKRRSEQRSVWAW